MNDDMTPAEKMVAYLHEKAGLCGHCGKRKCLGRRSQSFLPETIKTSTVLAAIKHATGEEP